MQSENWSEKGDFRSLAKPMIGRSYTVENEIFGSRLLRLSFSTLQDDGKSEKITFFDPNTTRTYQNKKLFEIRLIAHPSTKMHTNPQYT